MWALYFITFLIRFERVVCCIIVRVVGILAICLSMDSIYKKSVHSWSNFPPLLGLYEQVHVLSVNLQHLHHGDNEGIRLNVSIIVHGTPRTRRLRSWPPSNSNRCPGCRSSSIYAGSSGCHSYNSRIWCLQGKTNKHRSHS